MKKKDSKPTKKSKEDAAISKAAKDVSTPSPTKAAPTEQQKVSYETAVQTLSDAFGSKNPEVKFSCPPAVWEGFYKPALGLLARGAKILDNIAKEADEKSD